VTGTEVTDPGGPDRPGRPDGSARPDRDLLVDMYTTMSRIVACDEALRAGLSSGQFAFSYYSPRGQEAVAAGWSAATGDTDMLVTTYRGLHDHIAKGVPLHLLLAEMLGRSTGTNGGKGGPMHIEWSETGLMLTTGVVGSGLPIAAGLAWASQLAGDNRVTIACFGDGATNIGAFHEALNLASVWKLPVVWLCQNNGYGEHTAISRHQSIERISDRAAAYGMPGVTVDGNDPVAVWNAMTQAVERARAGGGPTLVEAVTYRLYGHVFGDPMGYVEKTELEAAWAAEPMARFRQRLGEQGVLDNRAASQIDSSCEGEVSVALGRALEDPDPDASVLLEDVTAAAGAGATPTRASTDGPATTDVSTAGATPPVSVRTAINGALDELLGSDHRVVLLGEDIEDPGGGVFGVTRGLSGRYAGRVRDTPISEQAIVGAAIGAALAGMRPVAEIMFMDFLAVCLDQLVNHAAKLRYMSGGKTSVPLVVRTAVGGGLGVGAQHSQMLEAWLVHTPGLKVVVPSTPTDARALLLACVEDDDPCVFIEQVPNYSYKEPLEKITLQLGSAAVRRPGTEVSVITYGRQTHDALAVAEELSNDGIEVEVVDLRSLAPLDHETMLTSVAKTKRAVVLHEAVVTGGFGGEIAALISSGCFLDLVAPVERVGAEPVPLPYAKGLERLALPGRSRLTQAIRRTLGESAPASPPSPASPASPASPSSPPSPASL
jgi:2-oxoisovalerate dehydrogenase E1 component